MDVKLMAKEMPNDDAKRLAAIEAECSKVPSPLGEQLFQLYCNTYVGLRQIEEELKRCLTKLSRR